MALQKPMMSTISAFDARFEQTITFSVNGGDRVNSNRVIIKLGSTNEVLYDDIQNTYEYKHDIPANTLTNGNYYILQVQTFNLAGGASALSSPVTFYCYSQPTFTFSNIPISNQIENAGYSFVLHYEQDEGEALNAYSVTLYNETREEIWTTSTIYVGSRGTPPADFTARIDGFKDNTQYYIRARGETEQLTELDTGYISFITKFNAQSIYTQMELVNNECEGYVLITSNVISLDGTTYPEDPIYINDEKIDLRAQVEGQDSYVLWEDSFAVYGDYTARIWLQSMNIDKPIATFYNYDTPSQLITLYSREETVDNVRKLYIEGFYDDAVGVEGYIYSNSITFPSDEQELLIVLQQSNNMYNLSIMEVGE